MIIFSLDCLADDSHRRHFIVKPEMPECSCEYDHGNCGVYEWNDWQQDYAAYYAACDQDRPISQTMKIITQFICADGMDEQFDVRIWSSTCQSFKDKTLYWLQDHIDIYNHDTYFFDAISKMRPIGDERPTEQLFEHWIDEYHQHLTKKLDEIMMDGGVFNVKEQIEMAFSADPTVIALFRRRGIFTFDCNQGGIDAL